MKDIILCQLIHLTVTDVLFMFSKICPPVSHRVGRLVPGAQEIRVLKR